MRTRVIAITHTAMDDEAYRVSGEIIQNGGLVAFPTETVYGLGANALAADASAKIYKAKGRPSDNPLIVHIAKKEQVWDLAASVSEQAQMLMDAFWPGPLTMIFQKKEIVPLTTTGGLSTVAIRMPDHEVALKLIASAGVPIAAPSANASGRPSPTCARHVYEDLAGRIDVILDDQEVGIGVESTIVDMTMDEPMILRPGYISEEMIKEVLHTDVSYDPAILRGIMRGKQTGGVAADTAPKAPGMKYRHYAPKAPLYLVRGPQEAVEAYIAGVIDRAQEPIGVLCTDETISHYPRQAVALSIGAFKSAEAVAHNLYARLREFDKLEVSQIYSECFGLEADSNLIEAIDNRLSKAAGGQVITVG